MTMRKYAGGLGPSSPFRPGANRFPKTRETGQLSAGAPWLDWETEMEFRSGRGAQRPRRANTAAEDQTLTGSGTESSARPGRRRGLSEGAEEHEHSLAHVSMPGVSLVLVVQWSDHLVWRVCFSSFARLQPAERKPTNCGLGLAPGCSDGVL